MDTKHPESYFWEKQVSANIRTQMCSYCTATVRSSYISVLNTFFFCLLCHQKCKLTHFVTQFCSSAQGQPVQLFEHMGHHLNISLMWHSQTDCSSSKSMLALICFSSFPVISIWQTEIMTGAWTFYPWFNFTKAQKNAIGFVKHFKICPYCAL